jgi:predicted HD superfamily hydrolase involved in NAD metabolism
MHSIGVSDTAACLAMKYGYDVKAAHLAGLLHDCAKGLTDEEMLATVNKAGMEITPIERDNPELLHSKAGSVIARNKYGINDDDILGAICYHTTGRPDMTLLEKIIFIADYIEPNRCDIPNLDKIREIAFDDPDAAVAVICRNSLDHLKRRSRVIDGLTVATYEFYRDKCKGEIENGFIS